MAKPPHHLALFFRRRGFQLQAVDWQYLVRMRRGRKNGFLAVFSGIEMVCSSNRCQSRSSNPEGIESLSPAVDWQYLVRMRRGRKNGFLAVFSGIEMVCSSNRCQSRSSNPEGIESLSPAVDWQYLVRMRRGRKNGFRAVFSGIEMVFCGPRQQPSWKSARHLPTSNLSGAAED